MDKIEGDKKPTKGNNVSSKESNSTKYKGKNRGRKRKRRPSDSSSEYEDILPENTLVMEKNLHASALKNNLDDISVRKILKKVVTNDHVLALVKLREEEEAENSGPEETSLRPKLTRAKVKELMRVSPKAAAWNLENLELTPIKHIPVKTRPEVKALIAQELPEDEDDEEYEPTNEDVPSDDDQGLESCSDLDSQPRTPATPRSQHSLSPKVVTDGPFKVPQDVSTPIRRKLDLEEEATIALRTRSKLSLSATSIEHIESTFVPPDDIPVPVDDLWNEFLNECLNPASTSKHEDDDETDPEYNVAADADAHDEDEEALSNSIIKISKKELNDLVTELFNIMPEATEDELMTETATNSVLTDHSQTEQVSTRWEGKQEPVSDEENCNRQNLSDKITFEEEKKKNFSRVSIGKSEPPDSEEERKDNKLVAKKKITKAKSKQPAKTKKTASTLKATVDEQAGDSSTLRVPPPLQRHLKNVSQTEFVHIQVDPGVHVLPEQVLILQQQLRQHIQLAASNFLQLFVHPVHWKYAPNFKEYIETFMKLVEKNPKSVANVCNLQPAVELVASWEKTVSANTPENAEMVQFIQKEIDRCFRRGINKNLYVGDFHETFKKTVANSPVFLYPYLLPSMPYRGDTPRRFCYLNSEDELIALGLEQFWQYVLSNPSIFKTRPSSQPSHCWGLKDTVQLIVKYMFPWMTLKVLHGHIHNVRRFAVKENPIYKFFANKEVTPVRHRLLPFNPRLSLYEQPEHEVPRLWVRYLAKTSKRFRTFLMKRTSTTGTPPAGVEVTLGAGPKAGAELKPGAELMAGVGLQANVGLKSDMGLKVGVGLGAGPGLQPAPNNCPSPAPALYQFVATSAGAYLLPLTPVTVTVTSSAAPVATPAILDPDTIANDLPETTKTVTEPTPNPGHCTCCILLRKICRQRQTVITEYFGVKKPRDVCQCKEKSYPRVSNKLRLLVSNYNSSYKSILQAIQVRMKSLKQAQQKDLRLTDTGDCDTNLEDSAYVTAFNLKLLTRTAIAKNIHIKKRVYSVLSKFNPLEHDPVHLATKLDQAFGNQLVDLYKEFLAFLTPEQADKIDAFKDYFIRNCVTELVRKVEMEVSDNNDRLNILEELHRVFSKNLSTACEICTDILGTLEKYPKLAQYVHSLFPHRKETRSKPKYVTPLQETTSESTEARIADTPSTKTPAQPEPATDYEADQSMSEEDQDEDDDIAFNSGNNSASESNLPIKNENSPSEYVSSQPISDNVDLVITVSKTEVQDFSESSDTSLKIVLYDDPIKSECPEWKRDEDKLILEMLKEHLTPEERQDKTILEILEEKNIIHMISESLSHKSKSDVKTRVLYLLQLC